MFLFLCFFRLSSCVRRLFDFFRNCGGIFFCRYVCKSKTRKQRSLFLFSTETNLLNFLVQLSKILVVVQWIYLDCIADQTVPWGIQRIEMCSRDVRRWTFTSEIIFMFKGHSAFELCRNLLNFLLHRLTQTDSLWFQLRKIISALILSISKQTTRSSPQETVAPSVQRNMQTSHHSLFSHFLIFIETRIC